MNFFGKFGIENVSLFRNGALLVGEKLMASNIVCSVSMFQKDNTRIQSKKKKILPMLYRSIVYCAACIIKSAYQYVYHINIIAFCMHFVSCFALP